MWQNNLKQVYPFTTFKLFQFQLHLKDSWCTLRNKHNVITILTIPFLTVFSSGSLPSYFPTLFTEVNEEINIQMLIFIQFWSIIST